MSALDFPNAPAVNDTYTAAGLTWVWDGSTWNSSRSIAVGPTGPTGSTGPQGSFGGATFHYLFSTDTTMSDPGDNYLRFNNATYSSVSRIAVDDNPADGNYDLSLFLQTIDDSTSNIKGHFTIAAKGNTAYFGLFSIVGLHTEYTNYFAVPISYTSGITTSFTNNLDIIITFARTGDKGDIGVQGVQGVQGSQGVQGIQGIQGTQGIQGILGSQGITGAQGFGTQGIQGSLGIQGVQGPQGVQGIQGIQGTNFSRTEYNYTATVGQTSFSAVYADGTDIDVYVNGVRLTPVEYTATSGTAVVLAVAALGGEIVDITTFASAGPQGVQGTQGTLGTQGTQGVQGIQGIQGVQGTQGIQGILGTQGVQGAQGVQGTQGIQGILGTQGTNGAQGTTGAQGATGSQGTQGSFGTQGTLGIQGTTGTQGIQGISGPSTIINAADDTSTATLYPVMVGATGSAQTAKARSTATAFSFNASTNTLSATTFSGALSGNASTATQVVVTDSRATTTTPQTINMGVVFDFKQNTTESLSDGGTYFGEMTFRQYGSSTDWSGGSSHQLGFTDNSNIWQRSGSSTTWGSWKKLLDSSNYSDYSTFSGNLTLTTTPFFRNTPTIASNYTVTTSYNEMSIGPITVNSGVTVTVNSGATWTVV